MEHLLADITWRPRIGDPNPMAWSIAIAHFVAGWVCLACRRRQPAKPIGRGDSRSQLFWLVIAIFMFILALNKQLDLQTLLTQLGRVIAKRDGWYAWRRPLQAAFVFGCFIAGLLLVVAGSYFAKRHWREFGLTLIGITFLLTFVTIRAASFHHVDTLIYHLPVVGNWMNAGLEFGGSLLVSLGAVLAIRRSEP